MSNPDVLAKKNPHRREALEEVAALIRAKAVCPGQALSQGYTTTGKTLGRTSA
jgi:hypothetical protein